MAFSYQVIHQKMGYGVLPSLVAPMDGCFVYACFLGYGDNEFFVDTIVPQRLRNLACDLLSAAAKLLSQSDNSQWGNSFFRGRGSYFMGAISVITPNYPFSIRVIQARLRYFWAACLSMHSWPINTVGLAMKIDEYVPTIMPITRVMVKSRFTSPPQIISTTTATIVVSEVTSVRLRHSFSDPGPAPRPLPGLAACERPGLRRPDRSGVRAGCRRRSRCPGSAR